MITATCSAETTNLWRDWDGTPMNAIKLSGDEEDRALACWIGREPTEHDLEMSLKLDKRML